jgi:hypothetical protein
MHASTRVPQALSRWLFSIGAVVALVAQVAVLFAPMSEAREGRSMAAHVELAGTATHYAHNDATCVTCQARTLHGIAVRVPASLPPGSFRATAISAFAKRITTAELFPHNSPRAPPTEI